MAAGRRNRLLAATGALLLLAGCAGGAGPRAAPPRDLDSIEAALARHIEVLASDAFEGRRPGTSGEAETLRYLAREWQAAGLVSGTNDPANPWFAPVDLALSIPAHSEVVVQQEGRRVPLGADEVRVFTTGQRDLLDEAPVIYVGRRGAGLGASELAGRVAVMEWDHPERLEQREALLEAGAAAVLAVADRRSFAENVEIRGEGSYRLDSEAPAILDGFVTEQAIERLIGAERWAAERDDGASGNFMPIPLQLTATIEAASTPGKVLTHNLIGRLPGRRPDDKVVLLLAHWDHFGTCGEPPAQDTICNGAVDNASGLAVLTELARALAAGPRLDRDVYFLATTAEEWGLLGARAFARNPPLPLQSVVAAFNIDTIAVAPRGSPVAIVGEGMTDLDAALDKLIRSAGRRKVPDDIAVNYLKRQDGWALLQRDVPAVMVSSAFARPAPLREYTVTRYHKPTDEAGAVELGGAAEDLLLHIVLVRHFANAR